MERIRIYFKPIWYNIVRHKAYAGFCVFGTMLTFVFITILLQIVHVVRGNMPPAFHAERIIEVPTYILDERGNNFTNRWNRKDVQLLMGQLKGYENYTCYHDEAGNIRTNGQFGMSMAVYTDYNYWNVFQFDFVQGRPFTEQEARDRWVVVNEGIAKTYFTKENVIGEKLYFQGNEYQIIGVVANVSLFAQDGNLSLWLPEHFDRGVSGNDWVNTFILFPEEADMENAKKMVTHAVNRVAEMKHVNVNNLAEPIRTVQEVRSEFLGGDFWVIGVLGVILLLLAIPILNIILLSLANTNIQVAEIGIKRALGAKQNLVFFEILVENVILVIGGTLLGIILFVPLCQFFDKLLFENMILGAQTILADMNLGVIFGEVLPLSLLFSIISGGLPAYWVVKYPITDMLKGGVK